MTKDLAALVGPDQKWETTEEFLDTLDKALAGVSPSPKFVVSRGSASFQSQERGPLPRLPLKRGRAPLPYSRWSSSAAKRRESRPLPRD